MTVLYIALDHGLLVARRGQDGRWPADLHLAGKAAQCVAADPQAPERVYCGTFGQGLWRSSDAGASWQPIGAAIPYDEVMAVAVSPCERAGGYGVVWAGAEPSALFRSEDGGERWQERPTLRAIPSAPTWSFPPRPWTHHVRWIAPDPIVAARLFVGIELGGVMRSLDAGLTWDDRKPGAQPDVHTLGTHALAPGHVYEAAGGGYAESNDGGDTWGNDDEGFGHHYLWSLAVDPGDPETVVISAAHGPRQAHDPSHAESTIYRRGAGENWWEVRDGLPAPPGTLAAVLAANPAEPGVFYAASNRGVYRSPDAGRTWAELAIDWPAGCQGRRAHGLAVVEID